MLNTIVTALGAMMGRQTMITLSDAEAPLLSHKKVNVVIDKSMSMLEGMGVPHEMIEWLNTVVLLAILFLIGALLHWVATRILRAVFARFGRHRRLIFFQDLINNNVHYFLGLITPIGFVRGLLPVAMEDKATLLSVVLTLFHVYIIVFIIRLFDAFVNAVRDNFGHKDAYADKPLESFAQVVKIFVIFIGVIYILAVLFNKNPLTLFGGLGALSAVLLLVFKDSILGFVASIQVSVNDMVRIGDWITIPSLGVDGDVIRISLTTVKIRAFDNTIITVPTYSLINNTMQNWRGMSDSGCRRIKRALFVQQGFVRFLSYEELEQLKQITLVHDFIEQKQAQLSPLWDEQKCYKPLPGSLSAVSNLSVFEHYCLAYLKQRKDVSSEMTMMVRQLNPTENGMPVEVYCFAATTEWVKYEAIMTDIFDHLVAAVPLFYLELFEHITNKASVSPLVKADGKALDVR